jgi:hypothetical protein
MNFLRRHGPAEPTDLDAELADTLADRLRAIPPLERPANEFAPEYSIEQVASFLTRHIKELDETRASLNEQADAARLHLAEVERRLAVTKIARDALADTSAKLIEKSAELEPKQIEHVEVVS